MPKKTIQRFLPDPAKVANSKAVRMFGSVAYQANLWHLNRRSASRAFAIGFFFTFMPVPFQMALAAGTAILLRANLPLSIALVWVSNPVTMPAIFYACYRFGVFVLGQSPQPFMIELSWSWFTASLSTVVPPFLLGCFLLGVIFSSLAFVTIRILWRQAAIRAWRQRQYERAEREKSRRD